MTPLWFVGENDVGRRPTPRHAFTSLLRNLEKGLAKTFLAWVCLNFTSFWDEKPPWRFFVSAKHTKPTKRARSLFGLWRLRALGLLERRPQNDSDNKWGIVFANSF
ncbi:MAG: hypothetical protein IJW69_00825, partial [Clostridia bacterium]|nr:hypothetical protein [Clostridia bacterium]